MNVFLKVKRLIRVLFGSLKTFAIMDKKEKTHHGSRWILHHDSASTNASISVRAFLTKIGTTVIQQPLYLLHLAPADVFLFPRLKSTLKGRKFDTIEEIKENCRGTLKATPKQAFEDCSKIGRNVGSGVLVVGRVF